MKETRLKQIIKEEVQRKLGEVSSYVQKAFQKIVEKIGADAFLAEMMNGLNDAQALSLLKSISQKYNIDLSGTTEELKTEPEQTPGLVSEEDNNTNG